jgi:thiol-disulfide isomerase/thioredoxin
MVIMVSTEWCVPCQTMKKRIIPRIRERAVFRHVAFAMVNPDQDAELADQLTGGGPVPQLVMYRKTANGWMRRKLIGGQSVEDVEAFLQEGLAADAAEKKSTAKTKEAADADSKRADAKQANAKQTDAKRADAKQANAKQADAKRADAKQADVKQADRRQGARQS